VTFDVTPVKPTKVPCRLAVPESCGIDHR